MSDRPMSDPQASSEAQPALPAGLEFVRVVGEGRMARVYLARESELGRLVAVKVLRADVAADETARRRFEREARSAASLTHPNVVAVHRFGRLDDGTPFLVMAHVSGRTLADRLKAEGPFDEAEVRSLLVQLGGALTAAHRNGIVHRDVRPGNVLVEEETGRYLLADFGIAAVLEEAATGPTRLTRPGQVLGDPSYAPPEQLLAEPVTGQADIYSLAVIAYEMLTGEGPHTAATAQQLIVARSRGEPRRLGQLRPETSPDLEDLLMRCLARDPRHRPLAQDLVRRLEADDGTGGLADRGGVDPLGILRRRMPQIVASTLAVSVVFLGLIMNAVDIERLPEVAFELSLNLVIWGLLASGVIAWFHGEKGPQTVPTSEKWIMAGLILGWLGTTALIWIFMT